VRTVTAFDPSYNDSGAGPFLDLTRAGKVLYVDKGTGFGLGRYEIIHIVD